MMNIPMMSPTLQAQWASVDDPAADHHLLDRVANGDEQAFEMLYCRYAPRIRSYLRKRSQNAENLDEVLNDVMMVIWHKATACPPHVPLLAWLYGIARRMTCRAYASHPAGQEVALLDSVSGGEQPECHMLAKDQERSLSRAISKLPIQERQPLELIFYDGCSYKDIAARLDTSVNTIKTRMKRAKTRLAAAVSQ